MIGLRRKFEIPNTTDELLLIQKSYGTLPKKIGIDPATVKKYILIFHNKEDDYVFIDEEGETDGFNTYKGAEQFARAWMLINYGELGHRWYIDKYPTNKNGALINKQGEEVHF